MKKIILLGTFILLSGCATTHNFFEITPTQNKYNGLWTGQYDQLVATLKLNEDGSGEICQDHFGTARVMSVKLANDRLYSQDGTYWKFIPQTPESIKLNYAIGGGYLMHKDDSRSKITPACKEKI